VLYGPENRFGAKPKRGLKSYFWYIVWTERRKKRERTTGAARESVGEAEKALADFLDARSGGWRGTRRPDQILIADMLAVYAEEHAPYTADPKRIAYAIDTLGPWWDGQTVSAITANTCRAYVRDREKDGRSSATARRELSTLQAAINYCHKEGKLAQPVVVTLPPKSPPRDVWMTRDDVALLLRAARAERKARLHLPQFILVSLYTGHRKDAVLGLQWQPNIGGGHVDLEAGIIDFQGRRKKTKKGRGKPLISRKLGIVLRHLRQRTRQYVLEVHGRKDPAKAHRIGDVKHAFASACAKAAEEARARAAKAAMPHERERWQRSATRLSEATPHTLRHTAVTWLVTKGLPLADVGAWVGMSPEMVERVYGHLASERMTRVRAAVDAR
jgi:integrase